MELLHLSRKNQNVSYCGIQFYILLSPFLCFIPYFIHVSRFIIGDDTSPSKGRIMGSKLLFALNYTRYKGKTTCKTVSYVQALQHYFTDRSRTMLLL